MEGRSPTSPAPPHATAFSGRRGTTRARGNSGASASAAAEEGRALFDADEERPLSAGRRDDLDDGSGGGGKWELGDSDDDDDDDDGKAGGSRKAAAENPWEEDADADEKDPIVRR
jgi:hypothetical protein